MRKRLTDSIKTLVDYASERGSRNAFRYYCSISKLLKTVEQDNQINTICSLATIGEINKGIELGLEYKDIYRLVKTKIYNIQEVLRF